MEAEKLEGLLIDYLDGKLSETERQMVEQELARNPEVFRLYEQLQEVLRAIENSSEIEPGINLQQNFDKALKTEMQTSRRTGWQVFFQPVIYRAAAAVVLLASGVAIGFWINQNQQRDADLQALRKEVAATKQMMMAMLDNTQSASQRMMGATVAFKMEKADDQIVLALTKAMNEDPNTNVRLAALEALGKFHHQEHVRKALIASLSTQKDPVVQIALIRLMVEIKEKEAMKELQRITNDVEALPAVKDEAHAGILKLS